MVESQEEELRETMKHQKERVWLPKVFCIFSPYQYYGYYLEIFEKLVKDMQTGGLDNLLEAYIYEIVCKIKVPVHKALKYRDTRIQGFNTRLNLPYVSDYFFKELFQKVKDVDTIITIFTHILCEEKIILVA
jgi:hypothetical protein